MREFVARRTDAPPKALSRTYLAERTSAESKALGARLRAFRKARGLTLQKLAEHTTLDFRHLQRVEAGTQNPTLATLVQLAEALQRTLPELFGAELAVPPANIPIAPVSYVPITHTEDELRRAFSLAILQLRQEQHLTQQTVAERASVATPYLQRLEAARQTPSLFVAVRIASALGVPLTTLLQPTQDAQDRAISAADSSQNPPHTDASPAKEVPEPSQNSPLAEK